MAQHLAARNTPSEALIDALVDNPYFELALVPVRR